MNNRFDLDLAIFLSDQQFDVSPLKAKVLAQTVAAAANVTSKIEDAEYTIEDGEFSLTILGIDKCEQKAISKFFESIDEHASLTIVEHEPSGETVYGFHISESAAYHQLLPWFMNKFDLITIANPDYLSELYREVEEKKGQAIFQLLQDIETHMIALKEKVSANLELKCQLEFLYEMLRDLALTIEINRDMDYLEYENVINLDFVTEQYEKLINKNDKLRNDEDAKSLLVALNDYEETIIPQDYSDLSSSDDEEEVNPLIHIPRGALSNVGIFAFSVKAVMLNEKSALTQTPPNTPSDALQQNMRR